MTTMKDQRDDGDPGTLSRSLRALRIAAGLGQVELAEATGLSQSQISRAETDRRNLSPVDVAKVAAACGAEPAERDRLVALAEAAATQFVDSRAILQRGSKYFQQRVLRYEEDSALVRAYQPGMVLGQMQSPAYARAVFNIRAGRPSAEVDELVAQRIRRGAVLRDPTRKWEFIQTEGALTWMLDGPTTMLEQIEHMATLSTLPNVDLGIIPAYQQADFLAVHAFHVYDADAVLVGITTGTSLLADREDVVTYAELFARLTALAVHGDAARDVLERIANDYRGMH